MQETQKILVKTPTGEEVEAKVITYLKDNELGKEYVLYTLEEDAEGDVAVYASIFVEKDNEYELLPIESDEEWRKIQEEIVKLAQD